MNLKISRETSTLALAGTVVVLLCGCQIAPLQVVPQPRGVVATPPAEPPQIPSPDPEAAEVPDGYTVDVVVSGLTYPSSVEFDDQGSMFVAESGYVHGDSSAPARVLRFDSDGSVRIAADHLNGPVTDLFWYQGRLYISHRGKVSVLERENVRDIITDLPSKGDHQNNQLALGPDGKLYLGQGTASNSGVVGIDNFVFGWLKHYPEFHDVPARPIKLRGTEFLSINPLMLTWQKEPMMEQTGAFQPFGKSDREQIPGNTKANGTILRFNPDGSDLEVYAWGLRNPYGVAH